MPVDMKAMIAGTYLQLVQHGNVDKITVKALIDACHISRQTFYYHFRDIMDVLEWSIQRETARLVEETLQVEGMGQALKLFISFAVERFPQLRRLLDSQKRVQLEAIMLDAVERYLSEVAKQRPRDVPLSYGDREVLLRFTACGLVGCCWSTAASPTWTRICWPPSWSAFSRGSYWAGVARTHNRIRG